MVNKILVARALKHLRDKQPPLFCFARYDEDPDEVLLRFQLDNPTREIMLVCLNEACSAAWMPTEEEKAGYEQREQAMTGGLAGNC